MLVLGLILILVAALVMLVVIVGGSGANDPARLSIGAFELSTSAMWLFLSGVLTLLVLIVGLDLLRTGLRKARQRRKDAKELDRLSAKLEQHEQEKRREEAEQGEDTGSHETREL